MTGASGDGGAPLLLTLLVLGTATLGLAALGWYGWRNAPELVDPALDEDARWRRERVVRRGSAACLVLATLFPAMLGVAALSA